MQWIEDAGRERGLLPASVCTIGNYDGIHRGQAAILERTVERAGRIGVPAVVVTFTPHPLSVVEGGAAPVPLTTRAQKRALLASMGVDLVAEVSFTRELASQSAEDFVRGFLCPSLGIRAVIVGSAFAFGSRRSGRLEALTELGRSLGFEVEGVPEVVHAGAPVSSTRIRNAVRGGDVQEAAELLGRPYLVSGTVVPGEGRGRELGFATANLECENELLPARGVYVTEAGPTSSPDDPSVTNVGLRPTFGEHSEIRLETHFLSVPPVTTGEEMSVRFLHRLRPERRFQRPTDLAEQIARDVGAAREYFRGRSG